MAGPFFIVTGKRTQQRLRLQFFIAFNLEFGDQNLVDSLLELRARFWSLFVLAL
jgi:hypothetical protein